VRAGSRQGFSLVEVTVAMGLITFAVVAVLGVLPAGLTSLRRAMDQTVEAQIIRSVGAQAITGEFATVGAQSEMFFDEEGQAMDSSQGAYYKATLTTRDPVYPASSLSGTLTNSLKSLQIELRPQLGTNAVATVYSINVANSGRLASAVKTANAGK
jgi:uncharacterized protein (TIGR02598 family)